MAIWMIALIVIALAVIIFAFAALRNLFFKQNLGVRLLIVIGIIILIIVAVQLLAPNVNEAIKEYFRQFKQ